MRSLVVVLWVLVVAVATPAHAATTCPAAPLPLTRADLPAAKVAVLAWMRADPRRAGFAARDLRGARGHAALATDPAARGLTAKRMIDRALQDAAGTAVEAPGHAGTWLAKPFRRSRKAADKSSKAGRKTRFKLPL